METVLTTKKVKTMAATKKTVLEVDVAMLKPHPLNDEIYSDGADAELVDSVKKVGVLHRVVVTPTYTIISGHRRWTAAMNAGLETIPIEIREDMTDPLDIEESLILSNRNRNRSNEQRAREMMHLERIESSRAEERQRRGVKADEDEKGRAIRKAAKKVNMGHETASKSKVVISEIDRAILDGDTEKAEELRDQMNKSVSGAHRSVTVGDDVKDALGNIVPDGLGETFQNALAVSGIVFNVNKARKTLEQLVDLPGGERIPKAQVIADCANLVEALKVAKPYALCPLCKADGCSKCDGLGWMHESRYSGVLQEGEG
jgi:ParB-like chromosome segregation protein Spo0J